MKTIFAGLDVDVTGDLSGVVSFPAIGIHMVLGWEITEASELVFEPANEAVARIWENYDPEDKAALAEAVEAWLQRGGAHRCPKDYVPAKQAD